MELVGRIQKNDVALSAWLTDALGKIQDYHINKIAELLPGNWKN
jgi:hypothetical protein